ncbi:MAG: trypsin-like peptidase domain-containing protein, partial [Actinomycetota bacterium]|nr:trypsin-like peptidase domain-containing protein [Actinomycetota bacterium]
MKRAILSFLALGSLLTACAVPAGHVSGSSAPFPISLRGTTSPIPLPSGSPLPTSNPNEDPVVAVVHRVLPSVVNVTTNLLLQHTLFGSQPGRGVGTGFVIRSDGLIVTNWHVVECAQHITVITPPPDVQRFDARVIGGDPSSDLAVVKIDGHDMPSLSLGDSSQLELGEHVVALGYALALNGGPTVTSGIVSALHRSLPVSDPNFGTRTYGDVIQTDAAINPGNSGGPLVNLAGQVVGIDTAGASQAENIGFAIAIDSAKPTIEQAVNNPSAPVAFLGVDTTDVTKALVFQISLPVTQGAYVLDVTPGSPAAAAGIKGGEVISAFDGKAVNTSDDLGALIQAQSPGDKAQVTVVDARGAERTVTV